MDSVDVGTIANGVADIYLADVLKPSPASSATAPPPRVTLSAGALASMARLYLNPAATG